MGTSVHLGPAVRSASPDLKGQPRNARCVAQVTYQGPWEPHRKLGGSRGCQVLGAQSDMWGQMVQPLRKNRVCASGSSGAAGLGFSRLAGAQRWGWGLYGWGVTGKGSAGWEILDWGNHGDIREFRGLQVEGIAGLGVMQLGEQVEGLLGQSVSGCRLVGTREGLPR